MSRSPEPVDADDDDDDKPIALPLAAHVRAG